MTDTIKGKTNSMKSDLYCHVKDRKEPLSKTSDKKADELKRFYLYIEDIDNSKHSDSIKENLGNSLE